MGNPSQDNQPHRMRDVCSVEDYEKLKFVHYRLERRESLSEYARTQLADDLCSLRLTIYRMERWYEHAETPQHLRMIQYNLEGNIRVLERLILGRRISYEWLCSAGICSGDVEAEQAQLEWCDHAVTEAKRWFHRFMRTVYEDFRQEEWEPIREAIANITRRFEGDGLVNSASITNPNEADQADNVQQISRQNVTMDPSAFTVTHHNQSCRLGNTQLFGLMRLLVEARGKHVSYEAILEKCCGEATSTLDDCEFAESATHKVRQLKSRLSKKLKKAGLADLACAIKSTKGHYTLDLS